MTIPVSTLAAFGVSCLFTLVLPIVGLIILGVKRKISARPLLIGALAFFISQVVLRLPILNILSTQNWFLSFAQQYMIPYMILLCVSAGLFEESARLVGVTFFCKGRRSFRDAVSFGLGHGICEVLLLVGLSSVNNLVYAVLVNNGSLAAMSAISPEAVEQITSALAAVSASNVYLGIVERVSAVMFHVFATVLIFQGVNRGHSLLYWLLAILAHAVFNLAAALLMQYTNVWVCEAFLVLIGLLGVFYVLRTKSTFPQEPPAAPVPAQS